MAQVGDDFPAVRPTSQDAMRRQGYVVLAEAPATDENGNTVWKGSVDFVRIASLLSNNARLQADVVAGEAEASAMRRAGLLAYMPGTFTRTPDGRVRYEFEFRDRTRHYYTLRGERIGIDTIADVNR